MTYSIFWKKSAKKEFDKLSRDPSDDLADEIEVPGDLVNALVLAKMYSNPVLAQGYDSHPKVYNQLQKYYGLILQMSGLFIRYRKLPQTAVTK